MLFAISIASCFHTKASSQEDLAEAVIKQSKSSKEKIMAADLKTDKNGFSHSWASINTVHGKIVFKFYPKHAPNTVTRIIELIQQGFYDGISFHRVVPNFVAQAGDPTGRGTGGSGKRLKAEFNQLQHIKGTLAMARAESPDSADSQFYISLTTLPHLDGKYTIFGQVSQGLDILEKISQGDKIISMRFQL